jgi:hypothetical protein
MNRWYYKIASKLTLEKNIPTENSEGQKSGEGTNIVIVRLRYSPARMIPGIIEHFGVQK